MNEPAGTTGDPAKDADPLATGKWLRLDEVADLVDADKSTVARWVRAGYFPGGRLRLRHRRGGTGVTHPVYCNPDDVRAYLAEQQRIREGS